MSDLLIRNISATLKRRIQQRAQAHGRSLSEEAKSLLTKAIQETEDRRMGSEMFNLIPPEDRGDDLVFEEDEPIREPPRFE